MYTAQQENYAHKQHPQARFASGILPEQLWCSSPAPLALPLWNPLVEAPPFQYTGSFWGQPTPNNLENGVEDNKKIYHV